MTDILPHEIKAGCLAADDVKQGIDAHFVDQYQQVFDLALQYDPAQVSIHQPQSETVLQA